MTNLLVRFFEGLFSVLIFSPGLRGLGFIYYILLFISVFFCIPLISETFKFFCKSKISLLLLIFYALTSIRLLEGYSEFQLQDILLTSLRMILFFIFLFFVNGMTIKYGSQRVAKYFLWTCLIASIFIYIQYIVGPINIFSEEFSIRAGLPRYPTLSGSTNMFSISVAFSILISTFSFKKINFLNSNIKLLGYQIFILGAAIANISRSGLVASLGAFVFSRFYLYFTYIDPSIFDDFYKIRYKFLIFKKKINYSTLFFYTALSTIFVTQFHIFARYLKTVLFFFTGNKALISMYSNATFENSGGVVDDLTKRLFWFNADFFPSLIERPWYLIIGGGSKYFGGTIGLPSAYAHNMFIDIFQALGIVGFLLFLSLILLLFIQSTDSEYKIIRFIFDIRSITVVSLFVILCTHNSGLMFHTLSIYPLIFSQDFLKVKPGKLMIES